MTTIANPPFIAPLKERVVLITGASGGVGAALSRACAAQGATVVLHGRVVRKLEALYDEIVEAGHAEPLILPLDLAKATADDFGNVATALQAQVGRLDALVHTAALLGTLGPIEHQSFDAWQRVLRINLAAPGLAPSCAAESETRVGKLVEACRSRVTAGVAFILRGNDTGPPIGVSLALRTRWALRLPSPRGSARLTSP